MARYIIDLNPAGYRFYNECRAFCQSIGQKSDDATVLHVFRECVSQIIFSYREDLEESLSNVYMSLTWSTILFIDENSVDITEQKKLFKDNFILFALHVFNAIHNNPHVEKLGPGSHYLMEQATVTLLTLATYIDSSYS